MAANLTQVEKKELAEKAVVLSARGVSNVQIAKQLGVNRKTVPRLLREIGAEISAEDRNALRGVVVTSINEVRRTAWKALTAKETVTEGRGRNAVTKEIMSVGPRSMNLVPLLQTILQCEDRMIKIFALAEPEEVNVNMRTPADRIREYEKMRSEGKLELLEGGKAS